MPVSIFKTSLRFIILQLYYLLSFTSILRSTPGGPVTEQAFKNFAIARFTVKRLQHYFSRNTIWSSVKYFSFHLIAFTSEPKVTKPNFSYSALAFKLLLITVKLICSMLPIV